MPAGRGRVPTAQGKDRQQSLYRKTRDFNARRTFGEVGRSLSIQKRSWSPVEPREVSQGGKRNFLLIEEKRLAHQEEKRSSPFLTQRAKNFALCAGEGLDRNKGIRFRPLGKRTTEGEVYIYKPEKKILSTPLGG